MTPATLPRNPKLRKPSAVCEVMHARQRSLEQLYLRRATLETLIRSLEVYDRTLKLAGTKLATLR